MPGLSSTTAAGLARRITPGQWQAVETGLAAVTGRMLALLPAPRAAALTGGPVTIDLDTTDVEVYGRKKRGVAYNHQGQRVGRPHVASWAEFELLAPCVHCAVVFMGAPWPALPGAGAWTGRLVRHAGSWAGCGGRRREGRRQVAARFPVSGGPG